jgi:AraC family ethanolamine operon transcriptional activator
VPRRQLIHQARLSSLAPGPLACLSTMSAYQYTTTESSDVNDHADSLSRWNQQYDQVSPGRFSGQLEDLWIGPVQVFRKRTGQAVLQRGVPSHDTLTVATPIAGRHGGWFCGRSIDPDHALGLVDNGEFELATRGDFDIVALCVERPYLEAYSRRVDGLSLQGLPQGNGLIDANVQANQALRELLLVTLDAVRQTPRLFEQEALRRALVHSLCDALMARLGHQGASGADSAGTAATRQRVVREARRYMAEHAEEPINVPELCDAIHVSRRTLQYAFHDVLQMSPVTYLRALRLNGVRRDLRLGGEEPVADRAARWGFWHLSRFAADYRHMFGELPSDTLKRAREMALPTY